MMQKSAVANQGTATLCFDVVLMNWANVHYGVIQLYPTVLSVDFCRATVQGHSKIFTTGQGRVSSEDYVIKCVGG